MGVELPSERDVAHTVLTWQTASADFAALMTHYRAPAPALRHFGLMHWQAQHLDVAAEALLAAVSLTPGDAHLWSDLAGAYDALARIEEAETCILKAIGCDPAQGRFWLMLAGIRARQSDPGGAEAAYRKAIDAAPALADAHFGLGLLLFDQRRLGEAIDSLSAAVMHAPEHGLARACLGHVHYSSGDFEAAASAFGAAEALSVPDRNTRLKHARARTFQTMIAGRTEEAIAAYPDLAGAEAEDIDAILRDAFGLLSAFGFKEAAIAVGRIRLDRNPDDPVQRYLQAAVEGQAYARAPTDYLEAYFDRFAPEFDHKLVEILRYRIPERLAALLPGHRAEFEAILDLGCGTGLSAEHLARFGGSLTGLDVSAKMLDQARMRGLYTSLIKAEAVAFLATHPGQFDLVFAADLLVYIGDLAPLFAAASAALRPGGLFALSIEIQASADFSLLFSGRFAHSRAYVERMAQPDFDIVESMEAMIRLEASRPVDGRLFVFRRR